MISIMLSSMAISTSSRRLTAPWRASPIPSICAISDLSLFTSSRAFSNSPLTSTGWIESHVFLFASWARLNWIQRSAAMARPTASTMTIGNMKKPPIWKNLTNDWNISFSSFLLAAKLLACADLVKFELPLEDVPVHRHIAFIQHRIQAGLRPDFRAFPGNDVQRFRGFIVGDDGHAGGLVGFRLRVVGSS